MIVAIVVAGILAGVFAILGFLYMVIEEELPPFFFLQRQYWFATKHKGDYMHFSSDGRKWVEGPLVAWDGEDWGINTGHHTYCWEYQLKAGRIPHGWERPKDDDA